MRKFVVAAVFAAGVAALATAALGSVKSPSSAAAPANAGSALVSCGKTRSIGLMAPFTGPAASIGVNQVHWARFYVSNVQQDAQDEVQVRQRGHPARLRERNGRGGQGRAGARLELEASSAVVGPAGSNEVKATTGALKGAGLGFVSGSATNTSITTDGTRSGYFFRTVPPDADQSKT